MQSASLREWSILNKIDSEMIIRKAFVFGETAVVLRNDGTIFGIGENYNNLLGMEEGNEYYECKEIPFPTKIKDFFSNGEHALAISEEGYLYSWGSNKYYQLGREGDNYPPSLVEKVFAVRIKEAVCGIGFSCVLTEGGKVYEWGINGYKKVTYLNKPCDAIRLPKIWKVVSIQASKFYPVILIDCGKVFIPSTLKEPMRDNHNLHSRSMEAVGGSLSTKKIIQVLSGCKYAFALTSSGEIFQWSSLSHVPDPKLVTVEIGIVIKLWTSSTRDVLVAANDLGNLYSISWALTGEVLSMEQLGFSSASKFFAKLSMQLEGPVYDDTDMNSDQEEKAVVLNEWRGRFEAAFDRMEDSDISFVVGGETIYAHRAILSIQSSYLNALLKNEWKSSENNQVTIKGYTHATYLRYMRFLYTGVLDQSSHEGNLELLKLAHEYMEKSLLKLCKKMVIHGLTREYAVSTYNVAIVLGLEDVQQASKSFIGENLEDVVLSEDFSNQDKDYIIKIVRDLVCSRTKIGEEKKE